MILELLLALIAGITAGSITGLAPGIHINLIAAILIASLAYFVGIPFVILAVFIIAMSITHTFIDFVPSVFLGAPDEDTFLSVLPGHSLLMEGKGYEALILTLYGSLIAIPIILIVSPLFIFFLPPIFSAIKLFIPFILIFVSLFLIVREKKFVFPLIVFLLAGFLGYIAFSLPVKEPLMPLLTGLFGLSSLFTSLKSSPSIKKQNISPLNEIKLPRASFLKSLFSAAIVSPFCSFLPGIGSGHAATIASEFTKTTPRSFLFMIGIINTVVMGLSFITLYAIGKTRTGSAAAVSNLLQILTTQHLIIILSTIVVSGILAFFVGLFLSKIAAKYITKVNYNILTISVIIILFIFNIIFTNWLGLIVLLTATFIGIFCILSNSRRINMMGSLLVPSIIFYLTF